MLTLAEAQDVRERLKVFSRMVDDLEAAVNFANTAQQNFQHLSDQIPQLTKERDSLRKQLESAKASLAAEMKIGSEKIASIQTQAEKDQQTASSKLSEWNNKIAAAESDYRNRMKTMEINYEARLADLNSQVATQEKKLATVISKIQSHKEAVQRL